jgi:glucose-6-phosphate 1-dehydrogenase
VGASGDLAKKKTYPSLLELSTAKLLPKNTAIWGFARTKKSHAELREHLRPTLIKSDDSYNTNDDPKAVDTFLEKCFYRAGNSYGDWEAILSILQNAASFQNLLVYLSIPPHQFAVATLAVKTALKHVKVNGFLRVVLEKPFGHDTDSCNELLQTLRDQEWKESDLYRIDHYLGKEMVQNILTLREHNPWLSAIWNKDVVSSVHLIFKEPFGTEGRGGYFDEYGIIRDILQNHLMQVLTLVAMDLPEKMSGNNIRDAKVDVLRSMPPIVLQDALVGQYDGYKDDTTIENKDTVCPTYACLRTWVNTETWQGVPFFLEAGKALDERVCEVHLNLKGSKENSLVLRLQPTPAIYFTANMKTPGFSKTPVSTRLGVDYGEAEKPGAYTRLILDVLRGQQASFVRDDELVEAWRVFTPLLAQLERGQYPPEAYQYGSVGPERRKDFLCIMGGSQTCLPLSSAL